MKIAEATLVSRNRGDKGLEENRVAFSSLEELSRLCLSPRGEDLPERVLLRVIEEDGRSCTLALSFSAVVRAPR